MESPTQGRAEPELGRKDAVLVRTSEIVDLLMDASNTARWMVHCHIAERLGAA